MTWKINKQNCDFLKFTEHKDNVFSLITLEYTEDLGYCVNAHVFNTADNKRILLLKNSAVFSDKKQALGFVNQLKDKINDTYFK